MECPMIRALGRFRSQLYARYDHRIGVFVFVGHVSVEGQAGAGVKIS